jgi:putative acetyltransferase
MMLIRPETQADIDAITEITKLAFENHPFSRNTEQFIILALRAADALAVSLVADLDGTVVGHIAFSLITLPDGSENWYGLGPVSVAPAYQKQGIGSRLVHEGLRLIKEAQAQGCVLVGDPRYYERFGFKSPEGLSHEGVPQENFMALAFGGRIPKGSIEFHPAFWATE